MRGNESRPALLREQAAAARERAHRIFQLAPAPYLLTDFVGIVLESNAAARDLLRDAGGLVRQALVAHVHVDSRAALAEIAVAALAGIRHLQWIRFMTSGGDVMASTSAVLLSGRQGLLWHLRLDTASARTSSVDA